MLTHKICNQLAADVLQIKVLCKRSLNTKCLRQYHKERNPRPKIRFYYIRGSFIKKFQGERVQLKTSSL